MTQYNGCFSKILYTNDEILNRIKELAKEINSYYKSVEDEEIIVISILDGSFIFSGHLVPQLDFNVIFKTLKISLYGKKTYAKKEDLILEVNFNKELVKNKKVLVLEDLLDTGMSLEILKEKLVEFGASDIKICVLFRKELKANEQIKVDWHGLSIPNEWVAGFGIDSRDKYRNFKHLGIVKIEKR